MSAERLVLVQYCDDVRQEIGNKYSLIGCYGGELIAEKLPIVLPKLCAQVKAITPLDRPFEKVILRAFLNDELLGEIELNSEALAQGLKQVAPLPDAKRLIVGVIMTFSPLAVSELSRLRIDVETEDETLRGTTLILRDRKPEEVPSRQ